jgi:hypothetical protein
VKRTIDLDIDDNRVIRPCGLRRNGAARYSARRPGRRRQFDRVLLNAQWHYVLMRAGLGASKHGGTRKRCRNLPRGRQTETGSRVSALSRASRLVSADGLQRRDVGSGLWLLHAGLWTARRSMVSALGSSAAGIGLASRRCRDRARRHGPYPSSYSYGSVLGALPYAGSRWPDGRSFITSVIRPQSDIWIIDRQH